MPKSPTDPLLSKLALSVLSALNADVIAAEAEYSGNRDFTRERWLESVNQWAKVAENFHVVSPVEVKLEMRGFAKAAARLAYTPHGEVATYEAKVLADIVRHIVIDGISGDLLRFEATDGLIDISDVIGNECALAAREIRDCVAYKFDTEQFLRSRDDARAYIRKAADLFGLFGLVDQYARLP